MKFKKKLLLWNYWANLNQTLLKWSLDGRSFQQSLVEIGSVVSEEKFFFKFHPPFFLICIIGQKGDEIKKKSSLKLLSQFQPNFAEMILRWSPFKNVSVSTVLYPRWQTFINMVILIKKFFFSKLQICLNPNSSWIIRSAIQAQVSLLFDLI
jgi:hypothetical protein